MKKILVGLGLLFSISAFGAAVIFSGNDVKTLKQNIDLNSIVKVISGSVDPSSSATSANKGSLYLSTNGKGYIKQDAGSSTTWNLIAINPMSTNAEMIYGGVNGVPTKLASGTNGYVLTMGANAPAWAAAAGAGTFAASSDTFSGYGTVTSKLGKQTSNGLYRARGNVVSGTVAASTASINLATSINTTVWGSVQTAVGRWQSLESSTLTQGTLFYDGSDATKIYFAQTTDGSKNYVKMNGNSIANSGETLQLEFEYPY